MRIKGTVLGVHKGRDHRNWRDQENDAPRVPGIWIEDHQTRESVFVPLDTITIVMREMLNVGFGTRG